MPGGSTLLVGEWYVVYSIYVEHSQKKAAILRKHQIIKPIILQWPRPSIMAPKSSRTRLLFHFNFNVHVIASVIPSLLRGRSAREAHHPSRKSTLFTII